MTGSDVAFRYPATGIAIPIAMKKASFMILR